VLVILRHASILARLRYIDFDYGSQDACAERGLHSFLHRVLEHHDTVSLCGGGSGARFVLLFLECSDG